MLGDDRFGSATSGDASMHVSGAGMRRVLGELSLAEVPSEPGAKRMRQ
jgi:hypothetical protein